MGDRRRNLAAVHAETSICFDANHLHPTQWIDFHHFDGGLGNLQVRMALECLRSCVVRFGLYDRGSSDCGIVIPTYEVRRPKPTSL